MSEYVVCETNYTSQDVLIEALEDIGITKEMIEVHAAGVALEGFEGGLREQKANIVIRRKWVGSASNDIGFEKQADGSYKAIVSSYDKMRGLGQKVLSKNTGGTGELDQQYAKRAILRTISKTYGHKLKSCEKKDNKIHIRVTVR